MCIMQPSSSPLLARNAACHSSTSPPPPLRKQDDQSKDRPDVVEDFYLDPHLVTSSISNVSSSDSCSLAARASFSSSETDFQTILESSAGEYAHPSVPCSNSTSSSISQSAPVLTTDRDRFSLDSPPRKKNRTCCSSQGEQINEKSVDMEEAHTAIEALQSLASSPGPVPSRGLTEDFSKRRLESTPVSSFSDLLLRSLMSQFSPGIFPQPDVHPISFSLPSFPSIVSGVQLAHSSVQSKRCSSDRHWQSSESVSRFQELNSFPESHLDSDKAVTLYPTTSHSSSVSEAGSLDHDVEEFSISRSSRRRNSSKRDHLESTSSSIRFVWSEELHKVFEEAIIALDDEQLISPKNVLAMMRKYHPELDLSAITTRHVKSHLQRWRINHSKRTPDSQSCSKQQSSSAMSSDCSAGEKSEMVEETSSSSLATSSTEPSREGKILQDISNPVSAAGSSHSETNRRDDALLRSTSRPLVSTDRTQIEDAQQLEVLRQLLLERLQSATPQERSYFLFGFERGFSLGTSNTLLR